MRGRRAGLKRDEVGEETESEFPFVSGPLCTRLLFPDQGGDEYAACVMQNGQRFVGDGGKFCGFLPVFKHACESKRL